jgi:hypothetical protein
MTGPREDWDDARLNAAFAARTATAPTTPSDLAIDTVERLEGQPRPTILSVRRVAPALGAAAAIALAMIVGAGQLARTPPAASIEPSSALRPSDSSPSAEPYASAPASATAMLGTALTVVQAAAIRDAGVDDREIVVTGFLGAAGLRLPCPMPLLAANPAHPDCPQSFAWLMQDPESLVTTFPDGSGSNHPPVGPAIHPSFALVEQPGGRADGLADPRPMTVVGHFDDRRAALCIADQVADCRDTFIVDRVMTGDDLTDPSTTVADQVPSRSSLVGDVDSLVQGVAPGVAILSNRVVGGGQIAAAEPVLASDPSLTGAKVLWLVTALGLRDGTPIARTFLVVDGTTVVREISPSGITTFSGPPSSPTPSASGQTSAIDHLLAHPMSVSEAIDHRDHHLDDTELVVKGFAWAPSTPIFCTLAISGQPALDQCPNTLRWIADSAPQPPVGNAFAVPSGPAFNLLVQPDTSIGVALGESPTAIIALGHFNDHRATACTKENLERCRHNFVVDALIDPADTAAEHIMGKVQQFDGDRHPLATERDVSLMSRLTLAAGDGVVIEASAIRGVAVPAIEPIASGNADLASTDVVWVVRVLATDHRSGRIRVTTVLIPDGPNLRSGGRYYIPTATGLRSGMTIVD